jgi:tetratricopeptide (TPR) repeat protein
MVAKVVNGSLGDVRKLLQSGIEAAKAGQRERARALLLRAVEQDERQPAVWLWLSSVVDTLEDREVCLENVLALEPDNEAARKGLSWVRRQMPRTEQSDDPTVARSSEREAEPASALPYAPSPQAETAPPDAWAAAPEGERLAEEVQDPFADEYLCPYCAAAARPQDRRCPACGRALWAQVRRREERSVALWNVMVVEFSAAVLYAVVPLAALAFVAHAVAGPFDPFLLLPVYLSRAGEVSPQVASAALEMVPRAYLWPFPALALYSLALLAATYARWRPGFYLLLADAGVRLAFSVVGMVIGGQYGLVCGSLGLLTAAASFFVLLQVEDDFARDRKRILLRIDRDAGRGLGFLVRARRYAEGGFWALSALHLRRALFQIPAEHRLSAHLDLAVAYLHLRRYDLAERTLAGARQLDPHEPRIGQLAAWAHARRDAERGS